MLLQNECLLIITVHQPSFKNSSDILVTFARQVEEKYS